MQPQADVCLGPDFLDVSFKKKGPTHRQDGDSGDHGSSSHCISPFPMCWYI